MVAAGERQVGVIGLGVVVAFALFADLALVFLGLLVFELEDPDCVAVAELFGQIFCDGIYSGFVLAVDGDCYTPGGVFGAQGARCRKGWRYLRKDPDLVQWGYAHDHGLQALRLAVASGVMVPQSR